MSYEPPTSSANLPTEIGNSFNESTPEWLREVATYAEVLAEHKEREARPEELAAQEEVEERSDDLPDDVPIKVTITIKRINDNRYCYWQWREGDEVTSKHKGPVNPDEWTRIDGHPPFPSRKWERARGRHVTHNRMSDL